MNMSEDIHVRIVAALREAPGLTARELGARLGEDKSVINSRLYSRPDTFFRSTDPRPRWWLQSLPAAIEAQPVDGSLDLERVAPVAASDPRQSLFAWQERALREWEANGFRGVIEAVTASGKTRIGLAAAQQHLDSGGKVAVLVPSRVLLEQWVAQIQEWIPNARVGRLGDGADDSLATSDLLVAVVNSASKRALERPAGRSGLLIADECHRYGSEQFRMALEDVFDRRLGLTATYERPDGEHERVLTPYFGGVVFEYGYADAVREGVIAPFRVALVPVAFTGDEREEYDRYTEVMRKARRVLLKAGAPDSPYQAFIQFVTLRSTNGTMQEGIWAGRYLSASHKRRDLLASTRAKYEALASLAGAIRVSSRSIVFTETIESARECADLLVRNGVESEALHSKLGAPERRAILGRFAEGRMKAIVAPRLLDEGVDVPEADLGVIVAASQQRRQMVQRMGRVLRRKQDGRAARFVIIFVEDTSEDPDGHAHETFLNEILDVAEDIQRFSPDRDAEALNAFLAP